MTTLTAKQHREVNEAGTAPSSRRIPGDPRLSPEQSIFPLASGAHIPISCAATAVSAHARTASSRLKLGSQAHLLAMSRLRCAHSNNRYNWIVTILCYVNGYAGALD